MRQIFAATVIFLFLSPLLAQNAPATDTASHVTLPLSEYDRLRDPDRPENVTVVDTLHLAGSFKERNLSVTFLGKSVGRHVATAVLQTSGGISLWGCSGSAVISRTADAFRLTPLSDSFSATCRIAAAGSDRLELVATQDVLAIDSSVGDGELIAGERSPQGTSSYSLVRLSAGAGENLAPTATGHYLITLLPDETRFRYAIDVHNPNRSRRPFEVRLRSGEHLQQVDADATYEVADGGVYRFDLPPGDLTLVMTGQLSGDFFTPPVDASLQYLAVENHPVVRPVFSGAVKRISAAEAGVPIQFRGPQAFLLGRGETIRWQKTKLEALHTVSYALSGTSHKFFIPAEGGVLGESVFAIDNQGASDVQLPLKPEPTYVSIQGEPLLMTKGADGKLTVPLSAGKQEVLVQHRQGIRHFFGFGFGRLVIPQLTVPSTSLLVAINYPRQWYPLAQAFSTRAKFWIPSTELTLVFLALLLWNERLFSWLGLPLKRRLWLAAALAGAGAAFHTFAIVVTFADGLLSVVWLVPHFKREKWTLLKGLFAAVVVVVGLVIFLSTLQTRQRLDEAYTSTGSGGIASTSEPLPVTGEAKDLMREASQNMSALKLNAAPQQNVNTGNYQGLPAKFEIPAGERHSYFGQEMLTTDREHAVTVVLVSSGIVWLLGLILLAAALLLLWRSRVALRDGLRARMAAASGDGGLTP
jgi:hypothetical protein